MQVARLLALAALVTGIAGCVSIVDVSAPPPLADAPSVSAPNLVIDGGTPEPATPSPTSTKTDPNAAAEFWGYVVPNGDNVEHYNSLASMTKASDAVVIGTITGMRIDARYQNVDLQGALFITMTLKIEQTLAGTVNESAPGEANLSVFVADANQSNWLAARVPNERAIFFLRNEHTVAARQQQPHLPDDNLYYLVVDDQGLIRDVNGSATPATPDGDFGTTVAGATFSTVVTHVRAAASS